MRKLFAYMLTVITVTAALFGAAGTALATPSTESAPSESTGVQATCYGGSVAITLPPSGYSGVYTTSSRCDDINLRIDAGGGQWVAVCWARYNICQGSWTWVPQDGSYHVVATDVLDGTTFYFVTTGGGGNRTGRVAY